VTLTRPEGQAAAPRQAPGLPRRRPSPPTGRPGPRGSAAPAPGPRPGRRQEPAQARPGVGRAGGLAGPPAAGRALAASGRRPEARTGDAGHLREIDRPAEPAGRQAPLQAGGVSRPGAGPLAGGRLGDGLGVEGGTKELAALAPSRARLHPAPILSAAQRRCAFQLRFTLVFSYVFSFYSLLSTFLLDKLEGRDTIWQSGWPNATGRLSHRAPAGRSATAATEGTHCAHCPRHRSFEAVPCLLSPRNGFLRGRPRGYEQVLEPTESRNCWRPAGP
jgi:hypothetical protein